MPHAVVGLRTVSGHPVSHWSPMTLEAGADEGVDLR